MAVLALFTGKLTEAQYDVLRKEVEWAHKHSAGAVLHAASFDDQGQMIHVADVWESEEALNAFVQTTLRPAFQKHGIAPHDVSVFSTHKVEAYASIDKYRV